MSDPSHSELCEIAVRWLKKSFSAGGHGCQIAFPETRTSFLSGESPDAIGFRVSSPDYGGGSVVVECKRTRSDFLADVKKPWRERGQGMGRFRYFLCAAGLIQHDDLPPGWGLLWIDDRASVQVQVGAALTLRERGSRDLAPFDNPYDAVAETLLLANLLHRIGDADKLNARLRAADGRNSHLTRELERARKKIDQMTGEYFRLQSEHERMKERVL